MGMNFSYSDRFRKCGRFGEVKYGQHLSTLKVFTAEQTITTIEYFSEHIELVQSATHPLEKNKNRFRKFKLKIKCRQRALSFPSVA